MRPWVFLVACVIDWLNQIIEIQNFLYDPAITRLRRMSSPTRPTFTLDSFLHAIPKAELHCHLLGTVRRETFGAGKRERAPLSDAEIEAFYTRGEKPVGVLRVLRALDAWLIKQPADLHRLAYEYLQDAAAHNVRYAEFFWNPTGTARESGIAYAAGAGRICCRRSTMPSAISASRAGWSRLSTAKPRPRMPWRWCSG
jgi:hypothetical protein